MKKSCEKIHCIMCNSSNIEKYDAMPAPFVQHKMFGNKILSNTYLYHCKHCDMYWSSFRPNEEEAKAYYHDYASPEFVKLRNSFELDFIKNNEKYLKYFKNRNIPQERKDLIGKFVSEHCDISLIKSVLDYGGGSGFLIPNEFCDAKKYVYEISDVKEPYKDVKILSRKELFSYKFDYIQCCQTLEHVSDPKSIINEMVSLLNENGIMYIEVPHEDFFENIIKSNCLFTIHEHINFFRASVLEKFFNNRNFRILSNITLRMTNLDIEGKKQNIMCLVKKTKPSYFNILLNIIYIIRTKLLSYIEYLLKCLKKKIRKIIILYIILNN